MTEYRYTTYTVKVSHPVHMSAEAVAAEVFEDGWNDAADADDWADGIYIRSVRTDETAEFVAHA
jgi:hypothetical protein